MYKSYLMKTNPFLILICSIILNWQVNYIFAQKPVLFSGFCGTTYLQMPVCIQNNNSLTGYCIDSKQIEKKNISGKIDPLTGFITLYCFEKEGPFQILQLRYSDEIKRYKGSLYQKNGQKFYADFNGTEAIPNYEDHRDLRNINDIYPLVLSSLDLDNNPLNRPFSMDAQTGRMFINPDYGMTAYPEDRKMIENAEVRKVFSERNTYSTTHSLVRKQYYQVLSYYPGITILVAQCESKINNSNSQNEGTKLTLMVFEKIELEKYGTDLWTNVTQSKISGQLKERIESKDPLFQVLPGTKKIELLYPTDFEFKTDVPSTHIITEKNAIKTKITLNWMNNSLLEID